MTKFVRVVLERETGIEPATNSLEGCDSTTELLPPTPSPGTPLRAPASKPACDPCQLRSLAQARQAAYLPSLRLPTTSPNLITARQSAKPSQRLSLSMRRRAQRGLPPKLAAPPTLARVGSPRCVSRAPWSTRAKVGGEGRVRTSVAARAAGLQPAAIDHSATSPIRSADRSPRPCRPRAGLVCSRVS